MQKVKTIRLKNLSSHVKKSIFEGQRKSARLWNFCVATHKKAREARGKWPTKEVLKARAKTLKLKWSEEKHKPKTQPGDSCLGIRQRHRMPITYKSKQTGIESFNGSDARNLITHRPECGLQKKTKRRWWKCPKCTFESHRDVVGVINMFPLAFDTKVAVPKKSTYPLREKGRSWTTAPSYKLSKFL